LITSKIIAVVSGLAVTLAAIWFSRFETEIIQTVAHHASKFIGPITGIFLMGILTRRGNLAGVIAGAVAGLFVAGLLEYEPIRAEVNWQWTAPLTCLTTFVIGYMTSLITIGIGWWGGRNKEHI
jgi:Na+/proline symporter